MAPAGAGGDGGAHRCGAGAGVDVRRAAVDAVAGRAARGGGRRAGARRIQPAPRAANHRGRAGDAGGGGGRHRAGADTAGGARREPQQPERSGEPGEPGGAGGSVAQRGAGHRRSPTHRPGDQHVPPRAAGDVPGAVRPGRLRHRPRAQPTGADGARSGAAGPGGLPGVMAAGGRDAGAGLAARGRRAEPDDRRGHGGGPAGLFRLRRDRCDRTGGQAGRVLLGGPGADRGAMEDRRSAGARPGASRI